MTNDDVYETYYVSLFYVWCIWIAICFEDDVNLRQEMLKAASRRIRVGGVEIKHNLDFNKM